jgi:hypothetical protein
VLFVSNIAPLCKLSRFACIRFYRLLYIPLPLSTHYIGGRMREGDVYGSGSFNTCKGKRLSRSLSLSLYTFLLLSLVIRSSPLVRESLYSGTFPPFGRESEKQRAKCVHTQVSTIPSRQCIHITEGGTCCPWLPYVQSREFTESSNITGDTYKIVPLI